LQQTKALEAAFPSLANQKDQKEAGERKDSIARLEKREKSHSLSTPRIKSETKKQVLLKN
jgi:hypothetical protein